MPLDTVALRSPKIDHGLAHYLEQQCIMKQGIELATGEILYEITTGNLDGSYDSRIAFRVLREEFRNVNGTPQLFPTDPFIEVEASVHKVFFGQNIYGGFTDFQTAIKLFIDLLGMIMADDINLLPSAKNWLVTRIDWAEMFHLSPKAIEEFFRGISHCTFPRRSKKSAKYGVNAVHFPGTSTTVKIYHKGPEFSEHDKSRMRRGLTFTRHKSHPRSDQYDTNKIWVEKKIKALQRLADNRLRAEVGIHAKKLMYDFNEKLPTVEQVTTEYITKTFDADIYRLIREGKTDMETVRTRDRVLTRLQTHYNNRTTNSLMAFWMLMAGMGEVEARKQYGKSQFYENRKKLENAGISWHQSNVLILPDQETALPRGFIPVRSNNLRVIGQIRKDSTFNLCPSIYATLKNAA